ncbi:MAG: aldose 1-epimerase family protein [Verrucomicrobiota bacterium]|nr:aldose 1-epimerase family protein [Verrucomicrobiota bacterium]
MKTPFLTVVLLSFVSCGVEQQKKISTPKTIDSESTDSISTITNSDFHPNKQFASKWSITREYLKGGKQEGVELLTLNNGKLEITVIPTRGMGILDVTMDGIRLGWNSPVKEVVHPSHIDLESRGGLGWLEGFNEWMVRCGLEFAGHPGTDQFLNNTGDPVTLDLTLHGKIQNIPASSYEILVDPEPPHRIRIRGTIYESFFYGPKLKLVAEISTIPGSDTFQISDQLTNEGSSAQEFQLIYHGNYGSSILEEGATVYAPASSVTPMNENAAKNIDSWQNYLGPTKGFTEQVYLLEPLGDGNSSTMALLVNKDADRATSVRWNVSELPYLTIWKNTAAVEDGYVTGIEPATGFPFNRLIERKYGRVPKLSAGETRTFTLDFGIHLGNDNVGELINEATDRQSSTKLEIIKEPPVTE